eukprot:CAMPEP_0113915810 /NCGR_PEP_ID=MMETSP0780_2-20120614/31550_1 /TAXON_ID=652834 /ORGANISM="Palpitomonas bilix" /LENGTH=1345 /DNA_ID=CAMNT_0000914643 /DNA_START=359 /DNA_END=4396 /DNA_ORIENTATION=+ /assembly_acc=CAM_ASM_000599
MAKLGAVKIAVTSFPLVVTFLLLATSAPTWGDYLVPSPPPGLAISTYDNDGELFYAEWDSNTVYDNVTDYDVQLKILTDSEINDLATIDWSDATDIFLNFSIADVDPISPFRHGHALLVSHFGEYGDVIAMRMRAVNVEVTSVWGDPVYVKLVGTPLQPEAPKFYVTDETGTGVRLQINRTGVERGGVVFYEVDMAVKADREANPFAVQLPLTTRCVVEINTDVVDMDDPIVNCTVENLAKGDWHLVDVSAQALFNGTQFGYYPTLLSRSANRIRTVKSFTWDGRVPAALGYASVKAAAVKGNATDPTLEADSIYGPSIGAETRPVSAPSIPENVELFTAPDKTTGRPLLYASWEGVPDTGDFTSTGVEFTYSYQLSTDEDFTNIIVSGSGVNSSLSFLAFNNSVIERSPDEVEKGYGFGKRFYFKLWATNYQSEEFGYQSLDSTSIRPADLGKYPYTRGFSIAYGHPAPILVKRGVISWQIIAEEPDSDKPIRRRFLSSDIRGTNGAYYSETKTVEVRADVTFDLSFFSSETLLYKWFQTTGNPDDVQVGDVISFPLGPDFYFYANGEDVATVIDNESEAQQNSNDPPLGSGEFSPYSSFANTRIEEPLYGNYSNFTASYLPSMRLLHFEVSKVVRDDDGSGGGDVMGTMKEVIDYTPYTNRSLFSVELGICCHTSSRVFFETTSEPISVEFGDHLPLRPLVLRSTIDTSAERKYLNADGVGYQVYDPDVGRGEETASLLSVSRGTGNYYSTASPTLFDMKDMPMCSWGTGGSYPFNQTTTSSFHLYVFDADRLKGAGRDTISLVYASLPSTSSLAYASDGGVSDVEGVKAGNASRPFSPLMSTLPPSHNVYNLLEEWNSASTPLDMSGTSIEFEGKAKPYNITSWMVIPAMNVTLSTSTLDIDVKVVEEIPERQHYNMYVIMWDDNIGRGYSTGEITVSTQSCQGSYTPSSYNTMGVVSSSVDLYMQNKGYGMRVTTFDTPLQLQYVVQKSIIAADSGISIRPLRIYHPAMSMSASVSDASGGGVIKKEVTVTISVTRECIGNNYICWDAYDSSGVRSAPHCEFIRVLQPGTSGVYPLSDFGLNSGETLKSIVERARGGLGALGFTWRSAFVLNPFVINPVSGLSKVGVTELALSRQIRTTDDEAMEGFLQRYGVSLSSVHLLNENPFPTGSYTGGGGGNLPVYSSYQPSRDVEGGVSEDDRTFVISSSFSTRTCFASNRGVETLLCASAKNATSMYTNSTSPLPPVEDATFLLLRGRRVVASFDTGENGTACMRGFFGDGPFLLTARASDGGVTIPCQGRLGSPIVMFNATVNAAVGVEVDPFRVEAAEVDVYMTSERDPCV